MDANNIESLTRVVDFWSSTNIWLLGAVGIIGILIAVVSILGNKNSKALRNLQSIKQDSTERIFNLEIENRRQENLRLQIELEVAKKELVEKQSILTSEQKRIQILQQKTTKAQEEAANTLIGAQFYLQQIRSWLTPRRLLTEDGSRYKFINYLKNKPIGEVKIIWAADFFIGEPRKFADDIADALKDADWKVLEVRGVMIVKDKDPLSTKIPQGLGIIVRDKKNVSMAVQGLEMAFLESGIPAEIRENKQLDSDEIVFMVLMIPPDGGRVYQFSKE